MKKMCAKEQEDNSSFFSTRGIIQAEMALLDREKWTQLDNRVPEELCQTGIFS